MAKPLSEKDRVGADLKRLQASSRIYKDWEDEFSCAMLSDYYYGRQWLNDTQDWNKRKYVINLFYAAIKREQPSLLFQVPTYRVIPRLTRIDDRYSDVEARAKLQEDLLNTFAQDPKLGYGVETGLAILDAQFRFGIIEVGYTADYLDNPNADRPIMKDGQELRDTEGNPVMAAKFRLKSEGLYLKWIPAKQVRTSERSANRLSSNDWVAYFEWQYIDDVRNNRRYKNTSNLRATGRLKLGKETAEDAEENRRPGMIKVWKLWDLRAKERRVFAEGGEKYFLEESFTFLPLAALKFDEILGQFLPMPPTYNWAHPQNQLNDMREMRRLHRKRAIRRYGRRPSVPPEEFAKLLDDEDMTCIELNNPETDIAPIPDAPLDPAVFRDEASVIEDFTRVSSISGESQQVAQSETATQANLIAVMGQIVQNANRVEVAEFLGELGRIMLMTLHDKMALPMWIKKAVDPASPFAPMEAQEVAKLWQQIVTGDIGDIDNDIRVDLSSMSPVQQAQERQDWIGFLGILTNPALGTILANSPVLMRKTAGLFNIHSERELVEVANALQMAGMMAAQAQAAKAGVAMPPGPGPTPTNSDIASQLTQQLPVELKQSTGIQ